MLNYVAEVPMNGATDDVVLDVEMLATLFGGLNHEPDLFQALQFVTLAEAAALRDKLIITVVDDGSPDDVIERSSDRALVEDFMAPLITAGAARIEEIKVSQEKELPDFFNSDEAEVLAVEDNPFAGMIVMARQSLTAERIKRKPALTLPIQQTFYEMSANVRGDHSVCDLSGHYVSLSKVLDDLRQQTRIRQTSYEVIPLPPIGLEVFRMASSIDDLLVAVVNIRERYEDLRKRLRELETILDDPGIPLKRKLRLKKRWAHAWEALSTTYDFTGNLNLANTNNAIYKFAPEIPGAMAMDPGSWINLLKAAIEQSPELWSRWRMRALHRTLRSYVASPDRDLGDAVAKIIKRPVTDDEVHEVREVQELMSQFSELAMVIYAEQDERPEQS